MDAVIFDVDGTLWDSAGMVTASWNKALAKYAPYPIHIEEDALKSMLGRPVTEFYDRFWGDLPQDEKSLTRYRFDKVRERARLKQSIS